MANATIKHFIFIQFFNWQNPNYPYNVLDVEFLKTQLSLTKNALRSLENQTNKNFEVIFTLNDKIFLNGIRDKKYDVIFSTLKDSTVLPVKFENKFDTDAFVKIALNEYDFVIQSRIDFDDFIFKDAVADTQSKVDECENILAYGYCKGYTYLYGELYPYYYLWNGVGHLGILQSFILKSSAVKKMPLMGIGGFYHDRFKTMLKAFLDRNSIAFSENMFQQNNSTNAFIYFRHEFSQEQLSKNAGNPQFKIPNFSPLTTSDITAAQLKSKFGFDYELKSIK